jgi:hypothetical protein
MPGTRQVSGNAELVSSGVLPIEDSQDNADELHYLEVSIQFAEQKPLLFPGQGIRLACVFVWQHPQQRGGLEPCVAVLVPPSHFSSYPGPGPVRQILNLNRRKQQTPPIAMSAPISAA